MCFFHIFIGYLLTTSTEELRIHTCIYPLSVDRYIPGKLTCSFTFTEAKSYVRRVTGFLFIKYVVTFVVMTVKVIKTSKFSTFSKEIIHKPLKI